MSVATLRLINPLNKISSHLNQRVIQDARLIFFSLSDIFRGMRSYSLHSTDELFALWSFSSLYGDLFRTSTHALGPAFGLRPPDFVFKSSDGEEFPVHKAVFEGKCEYFSKIFGNQFKEGSEKVCTLPLNGHALRLLRLYFYTGQFVSADPRTIFSLLQFSHMIDFKPLYDCCLQSLNGAIFSHEDIMTILEQPEICSEELKKQCFFYVHERKDKEWEEIIASNSDLKKAYVLFVRQFDLYKQPKTPPPLKVAPLLFAPGSNGDVLFKTREGSVWADRLILGLKDPYFCQIFAKKDNVINAQLTIDVSNCSKEAVEALILFIYKEELPAPYHQTLSNDTLDNCASLWKELNKAVVAIGNDQLSKRLERNMGAHGADFASPACYWCYDSVFNLMALANACGYESIVSSCAEKLLQDYSESSCRLHIVGQLEKFCQSATSLSVLKIPMPDCWVYRCYQKGPEGLRYLTKELPLISEHLQNLRKIEFTTPASSMKNLWNWIEAHIHTFDTLLSLEEIAISNYENGQLQKQWVKKLPHL